MTHPERVAVYRSDRFYGLRLGRFYFKLRDVRLHPLLFSERNGYGYRRLARWGVWELGVRT